MLIGIFVKQTVQIFQKIMRDISRISCRSRRRERVIGNQNWLAIARKL